jgi:hypothetical protein
MPAMSKTSQRQLDAANEAVDDMEPELRQLAGLVITLRFLGEADDSIEPLAISAIARAAGSTLDQIDDAWRRAMEALRKAAQSQPETRR